MEGKQGLTEMGISASRPEGGPRDQPCPSQTVTRSHWSAAEDEQLGLLVKAHGERWSVIANIMGGRTGKQCRERWNNKLRPNIKKEPWTAVEEMIFVAAHSQLGNKWAEIARRIPGRTENAIKNHWSAVRKQLANMCPEKSYSSVLFEYMKGLDQHPNCREGNAGKSVQVGQPSVRNAGMFEWGPSGHEQNEEDLSILLDWNDEATRLPLVPINEVPLENIWPREMGEASKAKDDEEDEIDVDELLFFPDDD